ncbi:MAG: IseA DL-endopeptidase inhibitor family protein [Acetatifactor sp.]|nr:IseA DL-endopeptidase inhibitor family protein [Acetatifactor sp.]
MREDVFASVQDLMNELQLIYTEQYIADHFLTMQNSDSPLFIDFDGSLYRNIADGYPQLWNDSYTVEKNSSDEIILAFTEDEEALDAGFIMKMQLVQIDGKWFINQFEEIPHQ